MSGVSLRVILLLSFLSAGVSGVYFCPLRCRWNKGKKEDDPETWNFDGDDELSVYIRRIELCVQALTAFLKGKRSALRLTSSAIRSAVHDIEGSAIQVHPLPMPTGNSVHGMTQQELHMSHFLAQVLRHSGLEEGLEIRDDGFVSLGSVLDLFEPVRKQERAVLKSLIAKAVEKDGKKRFQLGVASSPFWRFSKPKEVFIRAVQGHKITGIKDEKLLEKLETDDVPPILYHGTFIKSWKGIQKDGLSRMGRNHVHLSNSLESEAGFRRESEVALVISTEKLLAREMKVFRSLNGVYLCSGNDSGIIPLDCIEKKLEWKRDHWEEATIRRPSLAGAKKEKNVKDTQDTAQGQASFSAASWPSLETSHTTGEWNLLSSTQTSILKKGYLALPRSLLDKLLSWDTCKVDKWIPSFKYSYWMDFSTTGKVTNLGGSQEEKVVLVFDLERMVEDGYEFFSNLEDLSMVSTAGEAPSFNDCIRPRVSLRYLHPHSISMAEVRGQAPDIVEGLKALVAESKSLQARGKISAPPAIGEGEPSSTSRFQASRVRRRPLKSEVMQRRGPLSKEEEVDRWSCIGKARAACRIPPLESSPPCV